MKVIFPLLAAMSLAYGCATSTAGMSAEQITASAKAKDANVVCVQGTGPWGKASSVYVNVDKGVVASGQVTVDGECKVSYSNATPAKAAP